MIFVSMTQLCCVSLQPPLICKDEHTDPVPDPDGECHVYYKCVPYGDDDGLESDRMYCDEGKHYSEYEMTCLPPDEALCLPELRNLTCDNKTDLLSHPTNCSRYFECNTLRPNVRDCPYDMHFSRVLRSCVNKREAGCDGAVYCSDYDNPMRPTLLPDSTNCVAFYKCHHGKPMPMLCPNNLYFSVERDRCEFPFYVDCKNGVRPKMF